MRCPDQMDSHHALLEYIGVAAIIGELDHSCTVSGPSPVPEMVVLLDGAFRSRHEDDGMDWSGCEMAVVVFGIDLECAVGRAVDERRACRLMILE